MSLINEPVTRKEMYYSYLLGNTEIKLPEPITRIEQYLYALCQEGIGGKGTTDYNELTNKPCINNVELSGNISIDDIIPNGNEMKF